MNERRTALITGASSGFGVEFARLFARDGFDVVLVARSGPPMQALAEELQAAHGITATVIAKDLSPAGAGDELVADLTERGIRVDALVNNAGFAQYGPFADADPGVLDKMVVRERRRVDRPHPRAVARDGRAPVGQDREPGVRRLVRARAHDRRLRGDEGLRALAVPGVERGAQRERA